MKAENTISLLQDHHRKHNTWAITTSALLTDAQATHSHTLVYQPPLCHSGFQEGQAQPLHKLHPEFPEQGLVAVRDPAAIQAIENSGSCEQQHMQFSLVEGFYPPSPSAPSV